MPPFLIADWIFQEIQHNFEHGGVFDDSFGFVKVVGRKVSLKAVNKYANGCVGVICAVEHIVDCIAVVSVAVNKIFFGAY